MSSSSTEPLIVEESPELLQDPYPIYKRVREQDPVHFNEQTQRWLLTRHEDVAHVLRHDDIFHKQDEETRGMPGPRSMLSADPPDHTRLRGLVSRAFTARRVEDLRPRIEAIVERLLDNLDQSGDVDFLDVFAYPLPLTVIGELLGVPPEDEENFRKWSYGIALRLGAMTTETDPRVARMARRAGAPNSGEAQGGGGYGGGPQGGNGDNPMGLMGYFNQITNERRDKPGNDLITALIAAEQEGDKLNHGELISMLVLLLVAGHETTVNLLGNGLHALLRNRDQLERFAAHPELAKTAVEEFLRYDSPVQRTGRVAGQESEFCGKTIPKGGWISTLLGAANRDPEVYENPDTLDIGRNPNPQMSFSAGIHFCLGAQLARLEAQIAFPMLLERFPNIRLASDDVLPYRPAPILRGLETLPVRV